MANKIQIKRGSGSSALSYGELGFNKDSNLLYIGREDGQNQVIGGEHVLGGRNLLSCLPLSSLPFAKDASGAEALGELSYDLGSNSLHIINTNSNIRFWLWSNHPVLAGETYTVSCWVASAEIDSERGEEYQFQINLSSETETIDWIDKNDETLRSFNQPDPAKTGWVWKVIHQTFTVPTGAIKASIAFRTGFDYETYTNNFFVKNFKIERSHTYTDWSPAPEDIALRGMPTTANLTIQKSDPYLYLYNTDTNQRLGLHWFTSTEGTNVFGIYDSANSKHLMLINQDGAISLYKALSVSSGGTGATTAAAARANLGVLALSGGTMTGMLQIPSDNLRILSRNNPDTTDGGHILFQTGTADGNRDIILGTHDGGLRGYTFIDGEYQHLFNVGDNGIFMANSFYTTGTVTANGVIYANNTIQAKTTGTWAIDVNNPNGGEASISYSKSGTQKWVLGVGCGASGDAFALWNTTAGGLTFIVNADSSTHFYNNVGVGGTFGVSGDANLYSNAGVHGNLSVNGYVTSGDNMYANYMIARRENSTAEAACIARNNNGEVKLTVENSRGIWDTTGGKWILSAAPGSTNWYANLYQAEASYEFIAHGSSQSEGHFRGGVDGEGGYWEVKSRTGLYSYQFDAISDSNWRLYAWDNTTGSYAGDIIYSATKNRLIANKLLLTSAVDASETQNTDVALTIGAEDGQHLIIDNDEILSKSNASTTGDLYLQGLQIQHSGSIVSGTWNASTIGVGYGGTGSSTAEGARTNLYAAAQWVEGFTPAGARNNTLTDLLQINTDSQTWGSCDYPCWVGTEGGGLSSCPVEGVFYAYREVRKISSHQIMVTLTESYPRPGRVWTRTYDKNFPAWLPQEGWACNETIHYGTSAPTGILKGSIWLKPI